MIIKLKNVNDMYYFIILYKNIFSKNIKIFIIFFIKLFFKVLSFFSIQTLKTNL